MQALPPRAPTEREGGAARLCALPLGRQGTGKPRRREVVPRREDERVDSWLKGRRIIAIGERDGVQAESIVECAEAAGAHVAYAVTECFV